MNRETKTNKETLKELRERAEKLAAAGIANKDALVAALPLLIEFQEKVASARKNLRASEKTMAHLSELCSRYALGHEGVFATKRLVPNQQGVKTGDVVLDEATYHFASGYDGYVRGRREKMTQEFLASLPEKWCRQKLELNVSGINENAPSDAELAEHGLVQKPNNVWSLAEQGDGE